MRGEGGRERVNVTRVGHVACLSVIEQYLGVLPAVKVLTAERQVQPAVDSQETHCIVVSPEYRQLRQVPDSMVGCPAPRRVEHSNCQGVGGYNLF